VNMARFACPRCAATFPSRQALGGHMSVNICGPAVNVNETDETDVNVVDNNLPSALITTPITADDNLPLTFCTAELLDRPTFEYQKHISRHVQIAPSLRAVNHDLTFKLYEVCTCTMYIFMYMNICILPAHLTAYIYRPYRLK